MKKSIIVTLMVSASALVAGAALANHHEGKEGMDHDKMHAEKTAKMEAKLEEKFAKVDADANGSVTGKEFMAYKKAEAEAEWAKWIEGDADGAVTLAEAKAMHAAKMAEKKAMHEAMKMKDGKMEMKDE